MVCDDQKGGYLAAEHLIKLGHKNILFINTYQYISSSAHRLIGIEKAFADYNIDLSNLKLAEINAIGDVSAIEKTINQNSDCTAIICFSDFIALTVAHILQRNGKQIPEDVSIIGFDDIASKMYFPLMLTSVTSSKSKMTSHAVDALMKVINNSREHFEIVLPTKVTPRESTAKYSKKDGDVKKSRNI